MRPTFWLNLIVISLISGLMTGCGENTEQSIEQSGVLRVITRNGPTTYYEDKNGPTGFEYELASLYASEHNLKLQLQTVFSLQDLFDALAKGEADIAAAGLTITPERQQHMLFAPSYMSVVQYVLYHNRNPRPKSAADLVGSRLLVMANSSHIEILQQLKKAHPELQWDTATDVETIDLLDMVENGELDYMLIDSSEFTANKSFYPRIKKAFTVGEAGELAWALPHNSSTFMQQSLTTFFNKIKSDGTLEQLIERFYSHQQHLTQIDSRTFARAVEDKLPNYEALIRATAKRYNLDWRLLAAISYQESHWNPRARSHTGVRGMMMLTLPTAREMNIRNRLDPAQSLDGGARYFKKTLARLPAEILEPDRTWMALAAYNVGRGHLLDARIITKRRGGDPNRWADVKDNLPLLSQRRWYTQTRYGYARGSEPVQYVQNIRHFYNYLEWAELSKNRKPPPKQMDQYVPGSLDVPFNAL